MPNIRVPIPADDRRVMGRRVRGARWDVNLSMREVADRVGVTTNSVYQWEHGSLPAPKVRSALAKLFRVPEAELFAEFYSAKAAAS